ncbi:NlpC/P60 family protein [Marinicella meishanensis]|uniref:NlpC/P60 family protein n=1 Tax=Marinicella meishanensis TaxID=2873263 RepID=UPI001CBD6C81
MITFIGLPLLLCGLVGCSHSVGANHPAVMLDALYDRHEQWQGTPYELGGYDRQGIDCSGFVALTFAELFDVQLPRSTRDQAQIDAEIPESWLRTGDLVFFKIPKQGAMYHVGIYLHDDQFLHASTSRGVMISNLQADYWSDNFWKAVRVLP